MRKKTIKKSGIQASVEFRLPGFFVVEPEDIFEFQFIFFIQHHTNHLML